ncbi:MAG: hypothetical protein CMH62_01755 [Nanoarchaeota archaeon]|nr:hypothetical protein [Nanoarchaeota archaeon]|tara:strand:+ start:2521 stop:3945 length:1425 start_codon:yes stop_codon:yes gene_type:complete
MNFKLKVPEDKFTADVDKEFLFNLIEKAREKTGSHRNLYNELNFHHNLSRYDEKGISDNIRKWQKGLTRIQIPLDYYLAIGKLAGFDKLILDKNIKGIRFKGCRNNFNNYPLALNKDWIYVSELTRCEGHITSKRIALENTNTELIHKFRSALLNLGIKKETIKERLDVKIQIPLATKLEDLKIVNTTYDQPIKKPHLRILKLKEGNKKEVVFNDRNFEYNKTNIYLINYKKKKIKVSVNVPKKDKITSESSLVDKRYQKSSIAVALDISNKTLAMILNVVFEIPMGKKSYIIHIPELIKKTPNEMLKIIIESVLDAESTVMNDRIILGSKSKKYLEDLREILRKFNITSSFNANKEVLNVFGHRNIDKINEHFGLIKEKSNKINEVISNRKKTQSPKGQSETLYLKSISELGIADWKFISTNAGRTNHSSRLYLKELLRKDYIRIFMNGKPKRYRITHLGKKHLEKNKMYWLD